MLDEHLSWDNHIQALHKKISSGLFALRSMAKFCSTEVLKTIYFAHIHSHIAFGIALYGATSDNNLQSILRLQKKAIRIIMNLGERESVKGLFAELGIPTVYGLYIQETIMSVKTNSTTLHTLGTHHSYSTRNRNQLSIPKHSLEFYNKKPSSAGIKFFNKIPKEILSITNLVLLKKHLKNYITQKEIYSFNEFLE